MKKGLTFNGAHCTSKNVHMINNPNIPLLPEIKDEYVEMPYKDGSVLIPDNTVRDIFITVEFLLTPPRGTNPYIAAVQLQSWLLTKGRVPLIFDFMPGYEYSAKVVGGVESINKIAETGTFTVTFRCLPYPKAVV